MKRNASSTRGAADLTRRGFLQSAALASAGMLMPRAGRAALRGASKRKPNVVYVFADQLRADVVGCYGGEVHTPHIDALAQEGCRMTNCISTWPVCSPYRGMMLSGRYPMRNGVVTNTNQMLDGIPTLGTVFRDAGYATGYIGKWHLEWNRKPFVPVNHRRGFQYWAVRNCDHQYFNSFYCRDTPEHIPLPGWEPDGQTGLAVDYIRNHAHEPFCLVVSWGPPHDPYVAPESYLSQFPKDKLRFRGNVNERKMVDDLLRSAGEVDGGALITDKVLKLRARDRQIVDNDERLLGWWQAYLAMTKSLDDGVGRIRAELERQGLLDDTILVFTSDHGDMLGSHRMAYKQMPFEESIRVPFVVRYPESVARGRESDALLSPIDIMPTMASLAGLRPPEGVDGLDFKEAMQGTRHDQRDAVLLMKMMPGGSPWYVNGVREWRGLRTHRHTYTRMMDTGPWLLFDNQKDPLQLDNRINDPALKSLRDDMDRKMVALMHEAGDSGDTKVIRQFVQQRRHV